MKYLKLRSKQTGFLGSLISSVGSFLGNNAGSLISGGLSLAGGERRNTAQAEQAALANQYSAASSAKQMEFQERMSNTAHQREVKDLRAAGLNPILSSKYGGASTPTGSSFTGQQAEIRDTVTPAAQAYWSAKSVQAQVKNVEQDTQLKQARTNEIQTSEKGQTLTNEKMRNYIDNIQPSEITAAKQNALQSAINTTLKQTEDAATKEKLAQLQTRMTEAKSKQEYWRILGENAMFLTTAAKIAGTGVAIATAVKGFAIIGAKKGIKHLRGGKSTPEFWTKKHKIWTIQNPPRYQ